MKKPEPKVPINLNPLARDILEALEGHPEARAVVLGGGVKCRYCSGLNVKNAEHLPSFVWVTLKIELLAVGAPDAHIIPVIWLIDEDAGGSAVQIDLSHLAVQPG